MKNRTNKFEICTIFHEDAKVLFLCYLLLLSDLSYKIVLKYAHENVALCNSVTF